MNKKKKSKLSNNQTMKRDKRIIGDTFCFSVLCNDLKTTYQAYEYYTSHIKELKDIIDSDITIALDANLILNLYKMSFKERSEFLRFIDKNAKRIVITNQVEIEYLRHRVNYIDDLHRTLKELKNTPKKCIDNLKNACDNAIQQLSQFAKTKIVANDIPEALESIDKIKEFIETRAFDEEYKNTIDELYNPLRDILEKGVEQLLSTAVYELDDPVMKALGKVDILKALSEDELSYIHNLYNKLLSQYNDVKNDTKKKDYYAFPGCGDRGKQKIGNDPYGDLIIYHELLSYMYMNNKDVVFLTRDVSKSDWIKEDGKPFNHYIVDIYRNTEHMLYICNAEKFIPLTFASIVDADNQEMDGDLSEKSIEQVNDECSPAEAEIGPAPERVEESDVRIPYLRAISEERFIDELRTAQSWAEEYGDKYVNKQYFIYKILGRKRFDYQESLKVLGKLLQDKRVEEYTEHRDGNGFLCIKINS